jgi:hypothetical protein
VPLFEVNSKLEVATKIQIVSGTSRRILCRNVKMEKAVIEIVEAGMKNEHWDGLFYIMGFGELQNFHPLYVGKAERKGIKQPISANIANIRTDKHKFARWGDGLDYHIGDLSHALFKFEAYRKSTKKYEKWADALFTSRDPPVLKEQAYFYVAPWYNASKGPSGLVCSLPAVEKEVIALASAAPSNKLLNVDGI